MSGLQERYAAIWEMRSGPAWRARHGMTAADYQSAFNQNGAEGFRLRHISGYTVAGQERFAAIWEQDGGPAYQARHGLTAAQYQQEFDQITANGFRLTSVCGWDVGGQDRYAAIWEQRSGPAWRARHGMSSADYQAAFDQNGAEGFRLVQVNGYGVGGNEKYAAIWEMRSGPAWRARHGMTAEDYQAAFDQYGAEGFRLRHVSGYNVGGQERFAAIWEQDGGPAYQARHGLTSAQFQQEFDQITANGFRLSSICGYEGVVGSQASNREERIKILSKYEALGGPKSSLGLPADPALPLVSIPGGLRLAFRGGDIDLMADTITATRRTRAEVWWMGLECQVRQEGTDEVYGGIGVIVPGSLLSNVESFPDGGDGTWNFGPDGMRVVNTATLLYNGPPMDIVLSATMIEHDSGDTSEVKKKIAEAIAQAARALGAAYGVPAEATSATDGWINDLSLGLVNAIADFFGINDDQYTPQQLRLRWPEIQGRQFTRQTLRRQDDPRTIEFTHSIIVSGVDEGGDLGKYAFYFDVRVFEENEVL